MRRRSPRGIHRMSKSVRSIRDVDAVFRLLNLPTDPPAAGRFGSDRNFDPTAPQTTQVVEYRTILTNGTGKVLRSGYAELE